MAESDGRPVTITSNVGRFQESPGFKPVSNTSDLTSRRAMLRARSQARLANGDSVILRELYRGLHR